MYKFPLKHFIERSKQEMCRAWKIKTLRMVWEDRLARNIWEKGRSVETWIIELEVIT